MTLARTLSSIAALTLTTMTTSTWAASDAQHDSHHPVPTTAVLMAHAETTTPAPGMGNMCPMAGMPGREAQLKSMRDMHDKMLAAKTPEERNALMTEKMGVMQNGMNMMGGMGPGAMMGKPGDSATRQSMVEQRMEMMQSMMQMMMDRTQSPPMTK
ncbi:hypothetical protein [Rhodoferax sp. PAMC 29310]|uniref:hypothetical protein n=1 Tax=Rhodoferax sp. PAMC 29310 TaxID=2822760 RepID=UPI001F0AB02F|nr:hypothetical protein [Rhodoferax sp. PAMC 29310]